MRLGNCVKLSLRYCGRFEILARIGLVAYQLALPATIKVHNVFHVSFLKKYVHDATHVIDCAKIQVEPEGEFQVEPKCIIDKREHVLRSRVIRQVKVQWKHLSAEEATWEMEDRTREAYPHLVQGDSEVDS